MSGERGGWGRTPETSTVRSRLLLRLLEAGRPRRHTYPKINIVTSLTVESPGHRTGDHPETVRSFGLGSPLPSPSRLLCRLPIPRSTRVGPQEQSWAFGDRYTPSAVVFDLSGPETGRGRPDGNICLALVSMFVHSPSSPLSIDAPQSQ